MLLTILIIVDIIATCGFIAFLYFKGKDRYVPKITDEEFIKKAKKIHENKYDYSKVEYVNNRTKVCIICPEHGEFWQTPANHLKGSNCPKCVENQSKLEKEIRKMLEKENIYYIFQYKTDWLKHKKIMSIDFYLPDYNIAIECQGEQHFKPIFYFGGEKEFKNVQKRDKLKNLGNYIPNGTK